MAERFILMKHDPSKRNHEYLYGWKIVEVCGPDGGEGMVDTVRIEVPGGDVEAQDRAEYLAKYQLGRLQSGMEARSGKVFATIEAAREEAGLVIEVLATYVRGKQ